MGGANEFALSADFDQVVPCRTSFEHRDYHGSRLSRLLIRSASCICEDTASFLTFEDPTF